MEKQITLSDKKFYIVLIIAVAALIIGLGGLIVGLVHTPKAGQPNSLVQPTGGSFPTNNLPKDGSISTTQDGATNHVAPQQSGNASMQQQAR